MEKFQYLPKVLDCDVLLFEAVVVGHLAKFNEINGWTSADELLHLLRPEHDQRIGGADRVKAEIESPESDDSKLVTGRPQLRSIWSYFLDKVRTSNFRTSVTRFGEISPHWQNAKSPWPFLKGSFSSMQIFEPTLAIYLLLWANFHCWKRPKIE